MSAMSETVSNDVSTESLCTVIENCTENSNTNNNNQDDNVNLQHEKLNIKPNNNTLNNGNNSLQKPKYLTSGDQQNDSSDNDSRRRDWNDSATEDEQTTTELDSNRDTTPERSLQPDSATVLNSGDGDSKSATAVKLKKSVSFDPNDEKVRKFITGEPIVDQQNPFKSHSLNGNLGKKKKVPPPVPTKRSTLSIKKTVTQQLREREREKEKERERLKNETNHRKSNGSAGTPTSPEEFVTTEEVLKQSKYVKTYIKNPDPYFVYDPTILARIKFEELREVCDKKPPKKVRLTPHTKDRLRDLSRNRTEANSKLRAPAFKKCSKPNYPELSDIKIRVGTESDGNYFNPAEVTKNAKKFDERVKKLHLGSDDDLDEIEEPLTKSESSDEVTVNGGIGGSSNKNRETENYDEVDHSAHNETFDEDSVMNGFESGAQQTAGGTFTNTIKSKEFQEYLEKKGLTLIPKKIPSGAQSLYTNGGPRPNGHHISFKSPERVQISLEQRTDDNSMDHEARMGGKKPSVFQRLLANSIFASRRKTTPKELVPTPRALYANSSVGAPTPKLKADGKENPIKRVVLERQSFHGRPRAGNMLSDAESRELRAQAERTRKSFASGDDLSVSISSALTNAEYALGLPDNKSPAPPPAGAAASSLRRAEPIARGLAKPPRRTLSRDRLGNATTQAQPRPTVALAAADGGILKPKVQRAHVNGAVYSLPRDQRLNGIETLDDNADPGSQSFGQFQRGGGERQSMIPKRSTAPNEKRQVFGRSASMDRNEILKRTAARGLQTKSKSANGTLRVPTTTTNNTATTARAMAVGAMPAAQPTNLLNFGQNLTAPPYGQQLAGTPVRGGGGNAASEAAARMFAPISTSSPLKPTKSGEALVNQQEWERLRAMKERTDRELYYKMLQQQQQQQQQQQGIENIYEHLPNTVLVRSPPQPQPAEGNFIRGSPQRNTHTGVVRSNNRMVKIIDGRPVVAIEQPAKTKSVDVAAPETTPRSQSVLDGMTKGQPGQGRSSLRRGYESDNETPVVYRRKQQIVQADVEPRRIGGLLTREEILQKVKEFCRKSLNKTPTGQPQLQAVYEKQHNSTDISPVSYASVETHQRPGSRMYAAPQVPQRMQSLPQTQYVSASLVPQQQPEQPHATASPIYAHVVKRGSLQSNHSELYETPQRYLVRRESDTQTVYIRQGGTLQAAELLLPAAPQYVLVDGDKLAPAQLVDLYAQPQQPQYVRPHQLQTAVLLPSNYAGYHTLIPQSQHHPQQQQLQIQQQQQLRTAVRLHDGRTTPLILDRSSHQASQIYWTPQHQRLQQQQQQQHAGLLPIEISPRYALKQPLSSSYPVPAPRAVHQPQLTINNRAIASNNIQLTHIPQQHQQQQQQQHQQQQLIQQLRQQQNSPIVRVATPPTQKQQQQQQQQSVLRQTAQMNEIAQQQQQNNAYDWESGSEAGEVQRIMERRNGELKFTHALKNLRMKISRLVDSVKR